MAEISHPDRSIDQVADRLVSLLTSPSGGLRDPSGGSLLFEPSLSVRGLTRAAAPPAETWAVDGGQALVADARCLQVYVTRAAQVCWSGAGPWWKGRCPYRRPCSDWARSRGCAPP